MSEKSQALLEAALALDPAERRWLAEALLDSLDDDEEAIRIAGERKAQVERGEARMVPWDEAVLKIAEARWMELEKNPDSLVSHDEVTKLFNRK